MAAGAMNDLSGTVTLTLPSIEETERYRLDAIPPVLTEGRHHCCLHCTPSTTGKLKKLPVRPGIRPDREGSHLCHSDDPATFATWTDCVQSAAVKLLYLGTIVRPEDGLIVVDLDDCLSADGQIESAAAELVAALGSYCEVSASRTGLHVIGSGDAARIGRRQLRLPGRNRPLEVYPKNGKNRIVLVTGFTLPGYETIVDITTALESRLSASPRSTRPKRPSSPIAAGVDDQPEAETPVEEDAEAASRGDEVLVALDEVEREAFIAILRPWYQPGSRHDAAMAMVGYLANSGVADADAETILHALAEDDDEWPDRLRVLRDTYARWRAGLAITGAEGLRQVGIDDASLARLDRLQRHIRGRAPQDDPGGYVPSSNEATPADEGAGGDGQDPIPDRTDTKLPIEHFVAYLEKGQCLYRPTGKLWPSRVVDQKVRPVLIGVTAKGKEVWQPASGWLTDHRAVQQLTWAPGEPELIAGKLLNQGGWTYGTSFRAYNLYRGPSLRLGDVNAATPWLDHLYRLFAPEEVEHLIRWLASRVQRPEVKVNHALLIGGAPGIGKDTILYPIREAVGPWNFATASPQQIMGRFNTFLRSTILLIPEVHDLGDVDRYSFYEHLKPIAAAPPATLRVDEKFLSEIAVANTTGVVMTTNYRVGMFLPPDDRRHFAAWSGLQAAAVTAGDGDYFAKLYRWFDDEGGCGHVAAYLHQLDLADFDPAAPPPKTAWFGTIVDAARSPEDAELASVLDGMAASRPDRSWPPAVTVSTLLSAFYADPHREVTGDDRHTLAEWLRDRKNRRQIPHRMEAVGYTVCRSETAKDGYWVAGGQRVPIYCQADLTPREQRQAAMALAETISAGVAATLTRGGTNRLPIVKHPHRNGHPESTGADTPEESCVR